MKNSTIQLDLKHTWHPCSQMKDYEQFQPLLIKQASGTYLQLEDGRQIIDAISSWWCKSLGHNHPQLKQALQQQLEQFEHVILANTTHERIAKLSQKLSALSKHQLDKVFYAGDGSCAVEIAMKMSLHAHQLKGDNQRTQFIALRNGYHGETSAALSVSDVGLYREPYRAMLFEPHFIDTIPYLQHQQDPLWQDCSTQWEKIEENLAPYRQTASAILFEPIVQGAAGMKIYSADLLKKLRQWATAHGVHLIADEIMTGFGRTGKMLACEHADILPDFICLSKGLTSGFLPLSAVLTSNNIYQLFYDDYDKQKSFLHSHTYCGNALAVSVALEVFNIFEQEQICQQAVQLGDKMQTAMQAVADSSQQLVNVRQIGAIAAADLSPHYQNRRLGYEIYQQAVTLGALLRPIGNTLYWLPPLNTDDQTLNKLAAITLQAIDMTLNKPPN